MSAVKQRSPEWYDLLKHTIGSSDIYTIMGNNPFKHPIELYEELKNPSGRSDFVNDAMQRGSDLEQEALQWYNSRSKYTMIQPLTEVHHEYPFLRVSLDGIDFCGTRALEIKSPQINKLSCVKEYGVSDDYYCQIQYQYWFFPELKQIDLLVYQGNDFTTLGRTNGIFPVDKDPEFIKEMMDKVFIFMDCLRSDTPPPDTRNKLEYEEIETDFWKKKCEALRDVRQRIAIDTEIEENLKEEIKNYSTGKNMKGCGMSISHLYVKGSIDYSLIPELKQIDLEKYRKNGFSRATIKTPPVKKAE